jgi:tetratricopeptide (TPR) repeat protein
MRRFLFITGALFCLWILVTAGCSKPPGQREFDTAVFELKRQNYVRAKTYFEKSIARRPGSAANAQAYNYIGIANWKLGQLQAAADAFEDSRRLSPELVDAVYNLGVLTAESGDAARAVDLLQEAARMDPNDARALEYLGDYYAGRKQWPEARRALFAALERAPQSARILTSIALVDLATDGPERAMDSLMRALEKNSRYPPAVFNLAVIYQTRLQQPEQAATHFRKYLTLVATGPQADYARAALGEVKAKEPAPVEAAPAGEPPAPAAPAPRGSVIDELLSEASRLADKGQSSQALDRCIEASVIASRQKMPEVQERALRTAVRICFDQPRAHHELGRFLLERGDADAALKAFKQAIVLNREYAPAYIGMAQAAIKTGEYDAALVGLKQAVKADAKNADALWGLALLYEEKLDLPDQAKKTYQEFARLFPKDPRAATAIQRGGKPAPAPEPAKPAAPPKEEARKPAPAEEPETPAVAPATRGLPYAPAAARNSAAAVQAFNRGTTYQQSKDWERAIFYYLRALENDDTMASAFYNLGICYSVQGDYDLAKTAYLRSLDRQPNQINVRYNLALVYQSLGDMNSAIQLLRDVLKNKPDFAAAHCAIGSLYAQREPTWPLAKQHYQKYLQLAPNDPSAGQVRQWVAKH